MNRREFVGTAAAAIAAGTLATAAMARTAQPTVPAAGAGTGALRPFRLAYAPHFGMFQNHAPDLLDQIDFMADQGFTAIEDNGMPSRPREQQDAIAAALQRRSMRMGVFVAHEIHWGRPILASGDRGSREKFLSEIAESVELAKRLNARWATVVPGSVAQNVPDGYQTANVVEALRRAAELCEKGGLTMVLEPLNWRDHPGLFLRFGDQAYALVKAVASPACKILFDIYHQQATEGNLIQNIDRCWDEIAYFQIGDNPGRKEPGTGEINYPNVFRHIHRRGFQGVLGMEHGNSIPGKEGELAVIQAYRTADSF